MPQQEVPHARTFGERGGQLDANTACGHREGHAIVVGGRLVSFPCLHLFTNFYFLLFIL
jgi:hypothetical protein